MLSMLFVVAALFTLEPYAETQCLPACLPGGHLRWLTTVFSEERAPCFNLSKNAKRGFLLDCLLL